MTTRHVLVLGATGNQGGAVTTALLELGMTVRAMVRNPESDKAKALAARGVELVQGDFEHGDTIQAAAKGVDAAFVVTTPFLPDVGLDGEIRQGRTIIDALAAVGVPHVVYSSVSDADRNTGIGHFDTKADAERYLADSGLAYTITAPAFFAENVSMPWSLPALQRGVFRQAMAPNRPLQIVSLGEIGGFNAAVIARGPELAGRRINYAGDELTSVQIAMALSAASGTSIEFQEQPIEELRGYMADTADMFQWFGDVGYSVDIETLRKEFPEVGWVTFETWAERQPWPELLA